IAVRQPPTACRGLPAHHHWTREEARAPLLEAGYDQKEIAMHRFLRLAAAVVVAVTMVFTANLRITPTYAGTTQTYIVLYKGNSVAADAISRAGGTLVYSYGEIGVAIARSSSATFAADVKRDSHVE